MWREIHNYIITKDLKHQVKSTIEALEQYGQEGAEEDLENNANEDAPVEIEGEEREEQESVERPRKTSKYMTKYERARILGTRALQIRFSLFALTV